MHALLILAGAVVVALLAGPVRAEPAPQRAVTSAGCSQAGGVSDCLMSGGSRRTVSNIAGCPYAGATANCLMIKGADGIVYNITGINPRPRAMDRMIRVRGVISDKVSSCNQGVVLDRIRWTRIRQKCAN